MPLITDAHLQEPGKRYFQTFSPGDDFYEALIEAHNGLTDDESLAVNARLVLLLANHIGHQETLLHALELARASAGFAPAGADPAERGAVTPVAPVHVAA